MRKNILIPLVVLLIAAAVWYSYYSKTFTFLFLNDAMDYASIGRNIERGDGFISSYITPLALANRGGLPQPDLWRAPLWPMVLGVFIKVFGSTDQAVAIATGSFFILGAILVYLLGSELFDRPVGFLSGLVFVFSAQNLINSVSGMTETISVFLMLLAVYLAAASWLQNIWGDILAGVALGLFYLARYNALLFVPFFAIFLWYRRSFYAGKRFGEYAAARPSGFRPVATHLAAFAVTVSPWLIRNYLLMGSPLFSLQKYEPAMFTSTYPGYTMYMMLQKIDVFAFLQHNPQQIWAKVAAGWNEFYTNLFSPEVTGISQYLFWLFLLSLVIPFGIGGRDRQKGVRPLLVACFAVQLAGLLVVHFIYRLFFIFMPFYIIFGIAAAVWLLKRAAAILPVREKNFVAFFSILMIAVFIAVNLPAWVPPKQDETPIVGLRQSVKAVTDMSSRSSLIISNDGHLLAWYGDRYAAKLPYRVDMIPDMEKLAPVKFIYLSSRISWNIPEADRSWGKLFWSKPKEIYGFKLARVFPDGSVVYRKE